MTGLPSSTVGREYRAFPEIQGRDDLQVRLEVPLLLRALRIPTGGRLLEIGCGSGAALLELTTRLRPRHVAGVDIDRDLLDGARERFARAGIGVDLNQVDVRALPFGDECFDLIVDFGTCYHIGRPSVALREVARVLCTGGLFVHETKMSQLLAHPVRSFGRWLPWSSTPELRRYRHAVLWGTRRKI